MIAALYVAKNGCYFGLPDVEAWDEERDARLYPGPHAVVAHPPCARWCMLAGLVRARYGHKIGDDQGCFLAALKAVRTYGGVLEHPAYSKAWQAFGLRKPDHKGGWSIADRHGYTCHVEQGNYGHRARKATWLYAVRIKRVALRWGRARDNGVWCTPGVTDLDGVGCGKVVEHMNKIERLATPPAFRDMLLTLARSTR